MRFLCPVSFFLLCCALCCCMTLAAEVNHPVYPTNATESSVPSLLGRVKELMAMSDEELRDFVPKVNGFRFCGCPNCAMGTQEGQISWKGISDPDKAYCRYCKTEYPNPKFPEDKTVEGTNFKGEEVTYHFYEDAKGGRHHFTGRISYDKKQWLASRCNDLAQLYAVTKEPEYARKVAVLMDALAEAYSHWCVHYDWPFRKTGPVKPEPPFPTAGGMWNRWFYADVPVDVIKAYDLIVDSGEIEKLSAELGVDVRKRIEDDFFRFSVWFVRTYKEELSNMSPGIYQGLIVAGRVLGEPDYVHDGVDRFERLLRNRFFFDGFWKEGSISYHDQTIYWLKRVADEAKGYSDPEGYVCPRDDRRFAELDLMSQFPLAQTALDMNKRFVYPNGHIIPCHDAWATSRRGALAASEPWLLPGMGHAILGCGEGPNQVQAHLHFSGGYGHQHADNLNFMLFSNGRELLPDLGYTHTKYRAWSTCTPAHNTVAIDEGNHATSKHRCNLLLWVPEAGPAQVVEAESRASYPGKAEQFRRMVALIEVDDTRAYALDIFRVKGGNRHDYFLHGSADLDQTAECSLPMSPLPDSLLGPGVDFALPSMGEQDRGHAPEGRNIAYGFIQNVRSVTTDEGFSVSFRYEEENAPVVTTTVLGQPGTEVALGEAPSIRRAGSDDSELDLYKMPVLTVRRQGEDLQSAFVAVHRGWEGEDFIRSARALPGFEPTPGATAIVVEHALGKDVVFACTEEACARGVRVNGYDEPVCDGRFGMVRYDLTGTPIAQVLIGGTVLAADGGGIRSDGPVSGKLLGVRRPEEASGEYAFEVGEKLPDGKTLSGCTILVKHPDGTTHGYAIKSVAHTAAGSVILLEGDPGFAIEDGKTRFLYFPQREVDGENEYRVDNVVVVEAG